MRYLIIIILFMFSFTASALESSCFLAKYQKYADAQIKWQNDLTSLITKNSPELNDVADLYRDDQLLSSHKRLLAIKLLLSSYPNKVNTEKDIHRWLDLDSTDEEKLMIKSAAYSELVIKQKKSKHRTPHSKGNILRETMRTKIMPSQAYKNLYAGFSHTVKEINSSECTAI